MKRAFVLVLLSLVLPLVSSQPALARGKVYTFHNNLPYAIVVTFSTQACKPNSFSHTFAAKSAGTMTAACGTSSIDVVAVSGGKAIPHHHCWINTTYLIDFKFNVNPASAVVGNCTINAVAPGL